MRARTDSRKRVQQAFLLGLLHRYRGREGQARWHRTCLGESLMGRIVDFRHLVGSLSKVTADDEQARARTNYRRNSDNSSPV